MPPNGDGWEEWRNHVLRELERHNECVGKIKDDMDDLRKVIMTLSVDVTANKVKIALIGSIGGFIGGVLASVLTALILGML